MAEAKKTETKTQRGGIIRGTARTFFDVGSWFSLDYAKSSNRNIVDFAKSAFSRAGTDRSESFEAAMYRMGLSESDLQQQVKSYSQNVVIMVVCTIALALYALYLLFTGSFLPFFITLAVIGFTLVKAYQFSLWLFQIKQRKLGCTFQEWRDATFKGKK